MASTRPEPVQPEPVQPGPVQPRPIRFVLASASPARLATLRAAGLDPEVIVSGVEEEGIIADSPAALATRLAELKGSAVASVTPRREPVEVVLGCDSVLELDGVAYGKPGDSETATNRWQQMRGRSGVLHTGHHVTVRTGDTMRTRSAVASTTVHFAEVSDAEIAAYVATGEPLVVAGAFTLDGLGAAFVRGIEGDPHNVVGVSAPLLRTMINDLGLHWPDLWAVREPQGEVTGT
ncbi:MAG: Maf family nucleotide pyrophosphatase [Propionibacteriales bacterium]|nr:Maf family nucleotide pyrophosphatase [Propionibacteriales bacterium]